MQRTAPRSESAAADHASAAWKAAPFLFGSGFCALVYQVAWQREFRLVFGASTAASAAVIAIFMGALGAGGWVLGRYADRREDPWRFYARLEALVAIAAALTPPMLLGARAVYLGLGGTTVLGGFVGTLLRLALASLVLLPPMFLAGGTLPAAARAVQGEGDRSRRSMAVLYGINTLGAVAGAMAATFALLETFGTRRTLWIACGINLAVAILARAVRFRRGAAEEEATPASERPAAPPRLVYAAAGVVGFAFFLMELVWYRMLGPILGGTVYTFGLILAVALFGIGVGGLVYAIAAPRRPPTVGAFAATCWAEAACIAAPFVMGDRIAALALRLRPVGPDSLADYLYGWTAVTGVVVLPAAIVAGAQFPLLVALLGRGRQEVGRQIGQAYAWNTVGAIAGSLAGGFGIMPLLSAPGTWRAVAIVLALTGVTVAVAGRAHKLTALLCLAGTGAIAAAVVAVPGPSAAWRHSGIGAGRFRIRDLSSPNALRSWTNQMRRITQWEAEGVESSVAVQANSGYAFVVNGKVDGNARHDGPTQVMGGLVGGLLHRDPRTALVVGLGTGSTAGWLGAVPTMERVDVVELEPAIAHVARMCAPVNHQVMENPRVHVTYDDARAVLMTTKRRYDIVFSEPSNPYRAGVASFFTRDFYESAARRLAEGGLFLQWMQGYEVREETVHGVLATMATVFPTVEVWQTQAMDLLLIGTLDPRPVDAGDLARRIGEEPYRSALFATWRTDSVEGFLGRFIAGPGLARADLARGALVNTDDRNHVEFGFARTVGVRGMFAVRELREAAARAGANRPVLVTGAIDWDKVAAERMSMHSSSDEVVPEALKTTKEERVRAQAHSLYLENRRGEVAAVFRSQPRPATGPYELAMMGEALAEIADPEAEVYAARLHPVEGAVVRARLRLRQQRYDEAAAELERAFVAYRTDPWPLPRIMMGALGLAEAVVNSRNELAPRMFSALAEPFAVRLYEALRLGSRLRIAQLMPGPACREALAPLEPHIAWQADVLLFRRNCYESTKHPLLDQADRDLAEFLAAARPGEPANPEEQAGPVG